MPPEANHAYPARMTRHAWRLPLLFLLAALTCCASRGEITDPSDPWESSNRQVHDFNVTVDDAVIRPVAVAYRDVIPEFGRTRIRNFTRNLEEPRIFVNTILQGRLLDAGHTFMRFFFNSTAGIGGLFDVATDWGIERRIGDFGQTLYVWGLGDGPFVMLPVIGPSNIRDTFGMVSDGFLNPLSYFIPIEYNLAAGVVQGVDLRAENIDTLDALRSGSVDYYARLRSVWQQYRNNQLGRAAPGGEDEPDVLQDPGAPSPAAAPPADPEARPAPPATPQASAAPPRRRVAARPRVVALRSR